MKTGHLFFILLLLAGSCRLTAQEVSPELQAKWDKESSEPQTPLLRYVPSSLPDRITLVPLSAGAKEIAVTWRTDTTVKSGTVEIIPGDSISFPKDRRERIESTFSVVRYKDYPMHYHKAVLRNLIPGNIYKYRVGNSPQWSAWHTYKHQHFTDTIGLLYFGDTQNGIYNHAAKIYKQAIRKFDRAKFAVYIGDLINHANNDYEWTEWHTATDDVNTSMPVIATPGNHEYLKDLNGRKVQLSAYWTSTFPFSYTWDAGPFYLDFGFVRFIVLNSNEKLDEQGRWLDSVLNETTQDWTVLVWHHPVFSGARNRVNKGLQENWLPVIEKYRDKIGLVLQGHDHTYARGGLPERNKSRTHPSYPVFTVTVTGNKFYDLETQPWMDVAVPNVSSYQYIEITKDKIVYKAYSETDHLLDEFEIRK